ncbi:MAG: ABC transporter permease [Minwuia sp.]|nr:ABC transporter permease [Minwuia sp.]
MSTIDTETRTSGGIAPVVETGTATGIAPVPETRAQRTRGAVRWQTRQAINFWLKWIMVILAYVFLHAPLIVVIGASFNGGGEYAAIEFPPVSPSIEWYFEIPVGQFESLGLSFALAALASLSAVVIGVPAALGLVRSNLPGKALIGIVFRSPLQIPAVVSGIAFLQMFYLIGDTTGFYAQGGFIGLAIGHIFIAIPYVVGTVVAVLQRFDHRLEEAALSLGASPWRTFRRVTLPVIMPGVYAGALYAFMVSFGDVPLSIFLTAPGYVTYPVELFSALENDFDPSILASGTLVILFCLVVMIVVQRVVGLDALLKIGGTGKGR